ncbi:hypothetical protein GCM10020229_33940 [Kitasatospora albolonga]
MVLAGDDPAEAPGGRIALASLAGREWVHYAPGNGLAEVLDAACAAAGFRPEAGVRDRAGPPPPRLLAAAGWARALVPGILRGWGGGPASRPC